MATKLGAVTPLKAALRLSGQTLGRAIPVRQFTCTATRTKDVASQDYTPNLRHAQRPRESTGSLPYNGVADWYLKLEASCMRQL